MLLRYNHLSKQTNLFLKMTGLKLGEFGQLVKEVQPLLEQNQYKRLNRPDRQRAIGGGNQFALDQRDQILMTVIWLRIYPTNELLGYLFGVSDSTASRTLKRVLPVLAQNGRDGMRKSDPGKKHRLELPELLKELPELSVIVDSFEQKVQRPRTRAEADTYYCGKKKDHTLKSQVAMAPKTGKICHISESVVGPTADIKLFEQSGLSDQLDPDTGLLGDLGYPGLPTKLPGQGFIPRRKPRGQPRPPEDVAYNRAFAGVRIRVEHTIGRLRTYQSLKQTDRHHRQNHAARVAAVAGLVNRQIDSRLLMYRLAA
jgi:DDE superfamily endonuclease/Helix-turn-helix of DDE superfamily endonuclease